MGKILFFKAVMSYRNAAGFVIFILGYLNYNPKGI